MLRKRRKIFSLQLSTKVVVTSTLDYQMENVNNSPYRVVHTNMKLQFVTQQVIIIFFNELVDMYDTYCNAISHTIICTLK